MTPTTATGMPTHEDLPDSDGAIVTNYQELPQTTLLVGSLTPRLRQLRPDGQFSVGADNGIYWKMTDPPLRGCKSPDFFIVLGVPPTLDGRLRRSYVLWQERVPPLIVIEYVSGDGTEERDATPETGKFWVYERGIRADYYLIFDGFNGTLEAHRRRGDVFHRLEPDAGGRFPVPELGVTFGLWEGLFQQYDATWLRAWDATTKELIPSAEEARDAEGRRAEAAEGIIDDLRREADEQAEQTRQARQEREAAEARAEQERGRAEQAALVADQAKQRAEQAVKLADQERRLADDERQQTRRERDRADQAAHRAAQLAERLRQLGIDPDAA
ncbi:MAG: Uma2 family endonuclease [Gemmataceae bacterium]